jgi:hypothetical protein
LKRYYFVPLVLIAIVVSPWVWSEIYKGVDQSGRVFYSDRPIPQATIIQVPDRTDDQDTEAPADAAAVTAMEYQAASTGPYRLFNIVTPSDGEQLNTDTVQVGLLLEPPLTEGDHFMMMIDGLPMDGSTNTQFMITNVALGSHKLQVMIVNAAAEVIAATAVIHFHRQPSETLTR